MDDYTEVSIGVAVWMDGDRVASKNRVVAEMMQKALNALDYALTALVRGDEAAVDDAVWKTAFYLEYVTFILSLLRPNGDEPWKDKKRDRAVDLKTTLVGVHDLVQKALLGGSIEETYRKTWIARGRVLGIQRRLHRRKAKKFTK